MTQSTNDNGVHTPQDYEPATEALPDDLAALWAEHFERILPTMQKRGRVYLDVTSVSLFHPDLLKGADWAEKAMDHESYALAEAVDEANEDEESEEEGDWEEVEEATEPTPSDQVYGPLQALYHHFNRTLFGDQLPPCMITLQRKANTGGYYIHKKLASGWHAQDRRDCNEPGQFQGQSAARYGKHHAA